MSTDAHPTDFTPLTVEELSNLLPAYEIISFIAKGGMGAVYKAKQRSLDRPVAIKILPRHFSEDEQFRESFETEAKSMAKLNHPNLIGIYDFGEVDGLLYIVMELVEGESLYHLTYHESLKPAQAAKVVYEICLGLENAHKYGILHRDIKPANILIDPVESPKIGDFGLARPGGEHEKDSAYGTPGYTAPEVIDHPTAVDESTDLYAVGVIFYEILTGKLPSRVCTPASQLCGCSTEFDQIISRAIHPTPAMRFRNAKSMAEALKPLAEKASPPANPLLTGQNTSPVAQANVLGKATMNVTAQPAASSARPHTAPPTPIQLKPQGSFIRNIVIILVLLVAIVLVWEGRKKTLATRAEEKAQQAAKAEEIIQLNAQNKEKDRLARVKAAQRLVANKKSKPPVKTRPLSTRTTPIPQPEQPEIDATPTLRNKELVLKQQKCSSLIQGSQKKFKKLFIKNIKAFEHDIRYFQRSLTNVRKQAYAPTVESMTGSYDHNRISEEISRDEMPAKLAEILDFRLAKQSKIDKQFQVEIDYLQLKYRQSLKSMLSKVIKDGDAHGAEEIKEELNATAEQGNAFIDYILYSVKK